MTPSPAATTLPLPRPVPAPPSVRGLTLVEPLAGFPRHRDYVLVPAEDSGRLSWLQSVAPDGPRFLVVPAAYFPGYAPVIPGALCVALGLADPARALLYCLVTVPAGDAAAATANLRAPVVVNPAAQRARQVVLPDGGQPIQHPIGGPLRR